MVAQNSKGNGAAAVEHFATQENPFHFIDSGLDNVYLVGIRYFVHEDGKVVAEIPAVKQLMKLIAKDLVFSHAPLSGDEFRFLRKRMGAKSSVMSTLLRVELETFSRIENAKQVASAQLDLLMRMIYCVKSDDPELLAHCESIMRIIQQVIDQPKDGKVITMTISDQNTWSDLSIAA